MHVSASIPFGERQRMADLAVRNGVSSIIGCRTADEADRLVRQVQALGVECSAGYSTGRGWRVMLTDTLTLPRAVLAS